MFSWTFRRLWTPSMGGHPVVAKFFLFFDRVDQDVFPHKKFFIKRLHKIKKFSIFIIKFIKWKLK
jgi:hypothetical protein